MGLSVYSTVSGAANEKKEYETALEKARNQAKRGLMEDAEKNYQRALELKDSVGVSVELGEAYVDNDWTKTAEAWGQNLVEHFPNEAQSYEFLLKRYLAENNFDDAFQLQKEAKARGTESKEFKKLMSNIEYNYGFVSGDYDNVSSFCAGMCAVQLDGKWGYVDEQGQIVIDEKYEKAGCFSADGVAPIQLDGEEYYISSKDNKKIDTERLGKCENLSLSANGIIAVTVEGKSAYYDYELNRLSDTYDEVTPISGVGAVREAGKWYLIDSNYKKIGKNVYTDVKQDERGLVCMNDRCFVQKQGNYYLVDTKGKKVGDSAYEDVDIFTETDGYAAVKENGKWGFINGKGKSVISATYEDARAFSNGYAAVKKDGKWGFIDEKNRMVISPSFDDAKYFTSSGTVFVQKNGEWTMLALLKDNFE